MRSGTGRGTHWEVLDGSSDPRGTHGEVLNGSRTIEGPAERSWTDWGTLGGRPGWVEGPSLLTGTGRGALGEERDGSGDPQGCPGRVG